MTTRMFSKVTGAYFTYVADNADWNSDQLRNGGTHITIIIARGIYEEDPSSCSEFVAALAEHGKKSRKRAPRSSVPPAVDDDDDGVMYTNTRNPPSAQLVGAPKAVLVRNGDSFELATDTHDDDEEAAAEGFADEFAVQPFTKWLGAQLAAHKMTEEEFKSVNAELVTAAGKRLSWEEATARHAGLKNTFTLFKEAQPSDATQMATRRIGSCGEVYSKASYELAYALCIALHGAEATPNLRDHARRLLRGEKLTHSESVHILRPILLNPTSEEAVKAVLKMVIEEIDTAGQQTTMLTVSICAVAHCCTPPHCWRTRPCD